MLDRDAEAVTATGLHDEPDAVLPGQLVEPRTGGEHHRVEVLPRAVGEDDGRPAGRGVDVRDVGTLLDLASALADRVGQGVHELARVDEALAVQPDRRADLPRERRLLGSRLVPGQHVEVDALAGLVDVRDLLEQHRALLGGAVCREERRGRVGRRRDPTVVEGVEGLQRHPVDRHQRPHRPLPPGCGAVPGEAHHEAQQAAVGRGWDVDRRGRAEHRLDAVLEHGRLGQGRGDPGREPAGVPPGGASRNVAAVEDRHLDAVLLQEPCGRQADHAGSDDGNPLWALGRGRGD